MATRYYIAIPDPDKARAAGEFAFRSQGAESMARELQDALRTPALFERWRATQDDPDEVDPALGATAPAATVEGRQDDLRSEEHTSELQQLMRIWYAVFCWKKKK